MSLSAPFALWNHTIPSGLKRVLKDPMYYGDKTYNQQTKFGTHRWEAEPCLKPNFSKGHTILGELKLHTLTLRDRQYRFWSLLDLAQAYVKNNNKNKAKGKRFHPGNP